MQLGRLLPALVTLGVVMGHGHHRRAYNGDGGLYARDADADPYDSDYASHDAGFADLYARDAQMGMEALERERAHEGGSLDFSEGHLRPHHMSHQHSLDRASYGGEGENPMRGEDPKRRVHGV